MEMRNLSGQDLFPVITLLSKLGAKEIIVEFFKKKGTITTDQTPEEVGADFVGTMLETTFGNIERGKTDVNRLLASLCGVSVAEIEALDIMEYTELLFNFYEKPELRNFIDSISTFLRRQAGITG